MQEHHAHLPHVPKNGPSPQPKAQPSLLLLLLHKKRREDPGDILRGHVGRGGGATLDEVIPPPGGMTPTLSGRRGGVQAPLVGGGDARAPFPRPGLGPSCCPVSSLSFGGRRLATKMTRKGLGRGRGSGSRFGLWVETRLLTLIGEVGRELLFVKLDGWLRCYSD